MTVIIWSKDGCAFCDQAARLLSKHRMAFEERKLGHGWTKEDLLEAVPDARTVPQIFINDRLIGGFNELKQHLQETHVTQHTI